MGNPGAVRDVVSSRRRVGDGAPNATKKGGSPRPKSAAHQTCGSSWTAQPSPSFTAELYLQPSRSFDVSDSTFVRSKQKEARRLPDERTLGTTGLALAPLGW